MSSENADKLSLAVEHNTAHCMEVGNTLFGIDTMKYFHLDSHQAAMILASIGVLLLFCGIYKKTARVPHGLTNLLEVFVVFIRDEVVHANLGKEDGRKWTPYFLTLFFFILGMNLLGLIPGAVSATGNINVTIPLALGSLIIMTFVAIFKNGIGKWFHAFVPSGVPGPVLVGLVPLELLGVLIKCGSLAVRLFANMMAGHLALFTVISFVYVYGVQVAPAAGPLAIGIYALEAGVAILQAYIFTFLSAIFIGQIFRPDH
jgi:F-type H+-transporting ATPase subunit a